MCRERGHFIQYCPKNLVSYGKKGPNHPVAERDPGSERPDPSLGLWVAGAMGYKRKATGGEPIVRRPMCELKPEEMNEVDYGRSRRGQEREREGDTVVSVRDPHSQGKAPYREADCRKQARRDANLFLALKGTFGPPENPTSTLAYIDTMAGYNFMSKKLFRKIRQSDPQMHTWKYAQGTINFAVAVGTREFKASIVDAYTVIGGWQEWVRYGVGNVNSDCMLGSRFCRKFTQSLQFPVNRVILRDSEGSPHYVRGVATENKSIFWLCGLGGACKKWRTPWRPSQWSKHAGLLLNGIERKPRS